MSQLLLEIAGGQSAFEPGTTVEVDIGWEFDKEPKTIELRIVWNTSGKGDRDLEVVDTVRIDDPAANETRRIKLTLPREPYSFSGQLVSLDWALELVSVPSGDSARLEITIGPRGNKVQLPRGTPGGNQGARRDRRLDFTWNK